MPRQDIINVANSQVGITESPLNSNNTMYGEWFNLNGQPWCAIFVSWVYAEASYPLPAIDGPKGFSSVQDGYEYWRNKGELTTTPQMGDIVLFDWNGDGHCDHTGIFESWIEHGSTFNTIEGNTSLGNNSNGGQVMKRQRKIGSVKAFVSPAILGNTVVPSDSSLSLGIKGARVVQLQKMLHDLGYTVSMDGDFGPQTDTAVKQFQTAKNLNVDGIVTPAVLDLIQQSNENTSPDSQIATGSILRIGSKGSAVISLQNALNQNGANITVDGDFGNGTFVALKNFQQQKGLQADGIAGPATFSALNLIAI